MPLRDVERIKQCLHDVERIKQCMHAIHSRSQISRKGYANEN